MARISLLLFLLLPLSLCSCATVFQPPAHVSVTSNVGGATIYAAGAPVGTTREGEAVSVRVDRRTQTLEVRAEGYAPASLQVSAGLDGGWLVLDLIFGLLPLIVDAITGAWNGTTPNNWHAELRPLDGWRGSHGQHAPEPADTSPRHVDSSWYMRDGGGAE